MSFAGFMIHYLQKLRPSNNDDDCDGGPRPLSTIMSVRTSRVDGPDNSYTITGFPPSSTTPSPPTTPPQSNHHTITILLSGYSYGSLILSRLPPISEILTRFESAPHGTTAAEIILRSYRLAQESTSQLLEIQQRTPPETRGRRLTPADVPKPRLRASAVVVGGEETLPQERRRSRETSRGASIVRRSVEVPMRIKARVRRRSSGVLRPGSGSGSHSAGTREDAKASDESVVSAGAGTGRASVGLSTPNVRVRYLLVSPVLPPLAHTLVPPVSWAGLKGGVEKGTGFGALACPTLIVWGSVDSFTSNRRLKAWAERLSKVAGPEILRWRDFEGAGHFWREAGVMKAMTGEIGEWIRGL
jgi:pimeloyl-ACP methyl ester carboxylesterase